eukprot:9488104-Pyramimonas_sp.AAC.1
MGGVVLGGILQMEEAVLHRPQLRAWSARRKHPHVNNMLTRWGQMENATACISWSVAALFCARAPGR